MASSGTFSITIRATQYGIKLSNASRLTTFISLDNRHSKFQFRSTPVVAMSRSHDNHTVSARADDNNIRNINPDLPTPPVQSYRHPSTLATVTASLPLSTGHLSPRAEAHIEALSNSDSDSDRETCSDDDGCGSVKNGNIACDCFCCFAENQSVEGRVVYEVDVGYGGGCLDWGCGVSVAGGCVVIVGAEEVVPATPLVQGGAQKQDGLSTGTECGITLASVGGAILLTILIARFCALKQKGESAADIFRRKLAEWEDIQAQQRARRERERIGREQARRQRAMEQGEQERREREADRGWVERAVRGWQGRREREQQQADRAMVRQLVREAALLDRQSESALLEIQREMVLHGRVITEGGWEGVEGRVSEQEERITGVGGVEEAPPPAYTSRDNGEIDPAPPPPYS